MPKKATNAYSNCLKASNAYTYQLHPIAQEEYESSIYWYSVRNLDVAQDFVKSISKEIYKICKNPFIYRNEYKNYFEKVAKKYPFTIIYTVDEEATPL